MAVLFLADRRLQRNRLLRDLLDFPHPLHRDIHLLSDLLRRRIPAQLLQELPVHPDQFIDCLHHMHRNADRPGLVRDGPGNGLPDPPGGVGAEFEAFAEIEFLYRFDQAQIPFLNQIEEKHAPAHIALGDADHQTQIGLHKTLFGVLVAFLHPLCQLHLFLGGKQRNTADFLQVHADRVVDANAFRHAEVDFHLALSSDGLVNVDVFHIGILIQLDQLHRVVRLDFNTHRRQGLVNIIYLLRRQLQILKSVHNLSIGQDAALFPLSHQLFHFFDFYLLRIFFVLQATAPPFSGF